MDFSTTQPEYHTQIFKKLSHKNTRLQQKKFDTCTFSKCVFSESIFADCLFHNCTFKDCEMNLIKIGGCSFSNTHFENCQLMGVNWTETTLADKKFSIGQPVHLSGCVVNHSVFMWLNLKEITLTKSIARDADFSEADLTNANCSETDFANSRFWHTNLTGADFRGATNYTIPANLNTLKKTKFSLPEAMALLYSLDIILSED